MTCLPDNNTILQGEITYWSLLQVKGLSVSQCKVTLTVMEQPIRSPRLRPFWITFLNSSNSFESRFSRIFFMSKSSPKPPVKSSMASTV